jgi:FkbM family methyltransferase
LVDVQQADWHVKVMDFIRSRISNLTKRTLARHGIVLLRPKSNFGHDPWVDIQRLADAWNYSITSFFDVGANDGETALSALRQFPRARVTSFEPHPDTFSRLIDRLGSEIRFTGVNAALGTEIGEVEMFEYHSSKINSLTACAPYAVRHRAKSERIFVQCQTLDAYCEYNHIDQVDILKLDTEGYDLMVLQGGCAMLRQQAFKFIYVEFNDLRPKEGAFGGGLTPIDDLLRPRGYRFVASYTDYIVTQGELFAVSNALFALPPPPV